MSNIRAVVDTNVLIRTINRTNFDFFIYEAFSNERFDWVVSTAILDEYEEKLTEFYSQKTAHMVLEILCTADNVIFAEPHFRWVLLRRIPMIINFRIWQFLLTPTVLSLSTGILIFSKKLSFPGYRF